LFDLKTVSKLAKSIIEEKKQNNLVLLARNSLDSCNISIVNRNLGMQIASNLFIENITFSIILPEIYTHKQINLKMKLKHEMNLKVNVTHSSKKVFITFDDTITTNSNKNHNNNNNNNKTKQIHEQDGDDCIMREAFFCKELPLNLVWRKKGG
jgi:hypothetical protein